jgi:hypothetical protein
MHATPCDKGLQNGIYLFIYFGFENSYVPRSLTQKQ